MFLRVSYIYNLFFYCILEYMYIKKKKEGVKGDRLPSLSNWFFLLLHPRPRWHRFSNLFAHRRHKRR